MILKYYELPFGAQLLLWTSRVIINGSCRTNPNKYELVDMAFKKIGMIYGRILLQEFLSFLKSKNFFKLQSICEHNLTVTEVKLINCIENNKKASFNNSYYIDIWSISENKEDFSIAAKALANAYEKYNLNTDLHSYIITNRQQKTNFINNTLH